MQRWIFSDLYWTYGQVQGVGKEYHPVREMKNKTPKVKQGLSHAYQRISIFQAEEFEVINLNLGLLLVGAWERQVCVQFSLRVDLFGCSFIPVFRLFLGKSFKMLIIQE